MSSSTGSEAELKRRAGTGRFVVAVDILCLWPLIKNDRSPGHPPYLALPTAVPEDVHSAAEIILAAIFDPRLKKPRLGCEGRAKPSMALDHPSSGGSNFLPIFLD
ncbi:hypothetical protein KM043_010071 [Ampulex compressa]|nr:hypothetical protein KM043_010071 [Ampulex compressa]